MEILKAFLFGLSLAISIGPIALLIINQSINCGLVNGVKCGFGAAIADYFYALIAFFGGHLVFGMLIANEKAIALVSSLVLVFFGARMAYQAVKKSHSSAPGTKPSSLVCRNPILSTFSLTVVNPLTVIVFAGLSGQYQSLPPTMLILMATSLFIGSLIVQLVLALFGNRLTAVLSNPRTLVYLNLISGLAIIGFGIIRL
jgi:threonine/homoserine/homoserine lactone efflux protein